MYHLCALLGLHWHLKDTNSFVPRLVVFDQPSQAYFPSDGDQKGTDWDAVRSIYEMLFRFVMDTENQIQVLALDHADFSRQDDRFRAAVRANWHGYDGLIRDTPDQDPDD
ncbi:hypothetical protein BE21_13550 [Sorangium cellulosum]|uniref:DUF3732 domain-containing protein n=1 Tax=Sorangium cellulosum TaxID=56 RepID=A0A150TZN3_SORCE|nr:hypothetical protein BE21_13550 [Sorangium cellulosum]